MKQLSGLSLNTKKQKVDACSVFLIFISINQQLFYLALCTQICIESVKYLTKQNLGNWKRTLACSGLQIYLTIETLARVFSYEFCEIAKNTFFTEHLGRLQTENTPKFSCLVNIFGKILKSQIIMSIWNLEITVFLADINYLVKLLSKH